MFEQLGVFHRMGEGTDVVRKEMYDFVDKGGEHIALRPEGTASVVRAFVQHHPLPPWKVWYAAPSFRYERPQKGRVRQHHQVGLEAIGPADPDLDVEVIAFLWDFYRSLGLSQVRLAVNSMGDIEGRHAYLDELRAFLRAHEGDLDPDDAEKIESFPMRVLDTKRERSIPVAEAAPKLLDNLSEVARPTSIGCRRASPPSGSPSRSIPGWCAASTTTRTPPSSSRAPRSTRPSPPSAAAAATTAWSRASAATRRPGIGFGCGIERTLLACDHEGVFGVPEPSLQVFVVDVVDGTAARDLTHELRRAGISADRAWDGRSMKSQMKQANRSGAAVALIIGSDEAEQGVVTVRHLRDARDQEQIPRADLVAHLTDLAQIASTRRHVVSDPTQFEHHRRKTN